MENPLELQPYLAMLSRLVRVLALACAALAWISAAGAEDVANKPELHVGDVWFFHATGDDSGTKIDVRWRRRIVEIMPDGTMQVAPLFDTNLFDASWNPIFRERPDDPDIDFRFPMRVGDAWSYGTTGRATVDGVPYESRGSMKVVAYESITVPAGTFRCFRIEGETYWNSAINAQNPDWRYKEQWQITNWYCPDVRYVGRSIHRRYVGVFGQGGYRVLEHQLVAHLPGNPESPVLGASAALTDSRSTEVPPSQYDGEWTVSLECVEFEEFPAAAYRWRVRVRGGEFVVQAGTPGRPGHWRLAGRPSADETLDLVGTGISPAQATLGSEYVAHLGGRKVGAQFVLGGFFGARKCAMTLARA